MTTKEEELATFLEQLVEDGGLEPRLVFAEASGTWKRVADALNAFLDQLWLKEFQLSAKQEMLERVVDIRTNEVHEILDNVRSGFLLALDDQSVLGNHSRSCAAIFGRDDLEGVKLCELMKLDERAAGHFSSCYEQIFEDLLPVEVTLAQLPTEFSLGKRSFRITGSPITDASGLVTRLFFSIDETTELRKAEAENATRLALLEILRQRDSFKNFLFETQGAFKTARTKPSERGLRSLLHTTKGNLGCFGLHDIASLVHALEDAPTLGARDLDAVEEALLKFLAVHKPLLGIDYPQEARGVSLVPVGRILPLLERLSEMESGAQRKAEVSAFAERLKWVSARTLLAPLQGMAERTAQRMGKDVEFELQADAILVEPEQAGDVFRNIGHLVRNAVDHGIEAPAERGNKPVRGRVVVRCSEEDGAWLLSVADDGRGIDPDELARVAVRKGLISSEAAAELTPEQRLNLLFLPGLSTKDTVTSISGRGVGAGALQDAVRAVDGRLRIESTLGQGTTFFVTIPMASRRTEVERQGSAGSDEQACTPRDWVAPSRR